MGHQPGKNVTSEPFKGEIAKVPYKGTLQNEVYKGVSTNAPYSGEPNNNIYVGSQEDHTNIDSENQQQQNEESVIYPFKGAIIEQQYNGNNGPKVLFEFEPVKPFRGQNASEAYKGDTDSEIIKKSGYESSEPYKGVPENIPTIGVIVNYFNI